MRRRTRVDDGGTGTKASALCSFAPALRPIVVAALLAGVVGSAGKDVLGAGTDQPSPAPAQPPSAPPVQFAAKAELVLVDVGVTTNDSQPVTDLTAADFDLEVNGQPRVIASARSISTLAPAADAPPPPDAPSSNDAPTSGRLMLFVIDEAHIRFGGAQGVIRTAEMLLDQLSPGDLIGLARMPTGVGSVEFTADRRRIREALRRPSGTSDNTTMAMHHIQISEAFALESNDIVTWQQAVGRECAGQTDFAFQACSDQLEGEARTTLVDANARAQTSLRYLDQLFARLARLQTPVNVVMLSEGLFLGRAPMAMTEVSRRAAEARVTLHIVRPAPSMMADASRQSGGSLRSYSFDDYLMRDGLEQLAGQTRGRLLQVAAGTGAGIFQQLSREMSGYYLIGFEPTEADRTGRQRRIRVQVRRRGLTVRARPTFALEREGAGIASTGAAASREPEAVVKDLLAAPLPDRGLPMRVMTYNVTASDDPRIRVIVSAEIGEPAREPAEWQVGMLVLDKDDKPKAGSSARMILSPITPRTESPRLLQTTFLLEPGEYSFKLAVVDDQGRTGSVHHTIRARLTRTAGRQDVSDLLVAAEPTPPDPVRLAPAAFVDTEGVSFQLAVAGQNNSQLANTSVTIQVAESETAPPLTSVTLPLARREGGVRLFGGLVKLGLLPPGQYVARAVVATPGQAETRITRSFRYAPSLGPPRAADSPEAPVSAPPPSVDEEVLPPPPPRIAVRLPRFDPGTVLEPKVVAAFLESLETMYPPSPEAARVLARAREGRFDAPEPGRDSAQSDELAFAFVRGLSELQKKHYTQATAWFQVALKSGSDYLGSAFYIGACHAASGLDKEAVGAWQIALLSDAADEVYPPLVDGLLRLGDGLQALTFIDEAPDAWQDLDTRDERQATAEAMTGAYSPALEKLHVLIEKRPADLDLVYLTLQVMYRVRQESGVLSDADRARFAQYASRYIDGKGPNAALVATWLKFVSK